MKLGIMQPYFFPYLGYFSLIKATDKWIVFDTAQYVNRSWINRNRIIDPNSDGWKFFTCPVKKHPLKTAINAVNIQNEQDWINKILAQLGFYKKFAPYYDQVIDFLKIVFSSEQSKLIDLNIRTLRATCEYIGINFNYELLSQMNLNFEPVKEADEWGLNICKALDVTEFINPEGGQSFVDRKKYERNNISIKFLEFGHPTYEQKKDGFIPGLSILDSMMFNTPEEINQMLNVYKLV